MSLCGSSLCICKGRTPDVMGSRHLDLSCETCGWILCCCQRRVTETNYNDVLICFVENPSAFITIPLFVRCVLLAASKLATRICSKLWDMSRMCPLPISMAGPLLPFDEGLKWSFLQLRKDQCCNCNRFPMFNRPQQS